MQYIPRYWRSSDL